MPHNPNYDCAVRLAAAGLAVFPLRAHDRHPLVKWASESTIDTAVVTAWWTAYPNAIPEIDLGGCGLAVLDGDRHDLKVDGVAALRELLKQQQGLDLTAVPMVRTPRDGAHVYFRQPAVALGNRRGALPPGIDIKAAGGFVVAPGAVLPDGRRYEPIKGRPDLVLAFTAKAIPEVPAAVIALVAPPQQRARAGTQHSGPVRPRERAYAKAALRRSASELAAAAAGGRNQRLNKSAFVLGTMVARDWISREEVEDALTAAMERNGYVADKGPRAVEATLASGLNAGLASPHDDLPESESPRAGAEPPEVDVEIARLAALAVVEYENQRREAAEALGVRTPILDKLVEAERSKLNPDASDGRQGRAVAFPEPEPWPDSVDGAALLGGIAEAIRDHVVMSDSARDQTALWVVHTYMIDRFLVSPRLGVTSPVKGCGKTTLLDVLGRLVPRPLPTANITPAALFRVVEGYRPSLLVDEADSFLRDADELRGVLNSGHRKGGTVLRTVGDDHEPRAFGTYCATAIALIGQLPDTLHDRAVIIGLKRRLRTEAVTPYRSDRAGRLDELARKAVRWAKDHADSIAECDPRMPEGIVNRTADNWRPLLAVAEVAGGDWPERARRAAEAARIAAADDEASRLELLLTDIRDIGRGKVSMASAELVEGLVAREGRPWADGVGRNRDKPLTANRLAAMLKPVKITSENTWLGDNKVAKGYVFEHFAEAFGRYLPPDPSAGVSEPLGRYEADETGTSEPFQTARPEPALAVRKRKKPNNDGHPSALAVRKGGAGKGARMRASNGQGAPGPSPSEQRVAELVRWCVDRRGKGGRRDREAVEAGLRTVLQEELAPALVEAAFQRVIAAAFGC